MPDKFEMPAGIESLDIEALQKLRDAAKAEITAINSDPSDTLAVEALERLEALLTDVDTIDAQIESVNAAQAEVDQRLQAARERAAKLEETPASEGDGDGDNGGDPEPVEEPAEEPVEEPVEESAPEPVLASGTRRATVAKAARRANKTTPPKEEPVDNGPALTITAAANVPGFNSGQKLNDLGDVTAAFLERVQSFGGSNPKDMKAGVYQMSPNFSRHGVALLKREAREGREVERDMGVAEQFAIIMDASRESTLTGGSVIAAGGWCAPSETIYELFSYHTSEGTLDIPEVTARRGGIQFTKGPDFMSIYGDPDAGFRMTEAQAEAGTFTKPCYALECPPFEEVRLDAVGFCATAPLLTNAAYPELTRQVLDMLGAGHARRKSAQTIASIVGSIATTINWSELSGGVSSGLADALGGLELQALRIRQSLAMSPTATIEGFAPYWIRPAFRNELSRRLGLQDPFNVTDADVDRYLATRGIRLQYVYDYQMLSEATTATWTAWPTTVEFSLYPAGAYTRLVNDVIKLDAVYDHDMLTGNEYTAAFVEEGMAVANTRGYGVKMSVDLRYTGAAGFPGIGAGEGVTFATAA